jgi:hypothetical protein
MAGIEHHSQATLPEYTQAPCLPAMAAPLHAADGILAQMETPS